MEIILAVTVIALLLVVGVAAAADHTVPARHHRGPTVAEIRARLDAEAARTLIPMRG
ncbi:hypothetical protein IU501_23155 [Nocardia otitidiscaviarum]|uniref:DUF4175 domain-containing protein n=1 Tax=Nocardia otitidiscaviarum TaxID=1823 RepID=UPI000B32F2A9|nr:DUF4175 domain-containing protein [Nocardia otitidiscaviarum]MBF6135894.1 hypothetical protein [Nocardia otitidiscaviarum]